MRQCLANFALFLRDFRGTLTVRGKRAIISLDSHAPTTRRQPFWRRNVPGVDDQPALLAGVGDASLSTARTFAMSACRSAMTVCSGDPT